MRTLVWFRSDLRVADNPALHHSCQRGKVTACYIHAPEKWKRIGYSRSKKDFIVGSLLVLENTLAQLRIPLHVIEVRNDLEIPRTLVQLALSHHCQNIAFNQRILIDDRLQDELIERTAKSSGIDTTPYHAATLVPPGQINNSSGDFYKVFTPYFHKWTHYVQNTDVQTLAVPQSQNTTHISTKWINRSDLQIENSKTHWSPGEFAAIKQLTNFCSNNDKYASQRDIPSLSATSLLSAHLSIGTISARQCLKYASESSSPMDAWIRQLAWRDFYTHLMLENPDLCRGLPFRSDSDRIPWRHDKEQFNRWCDGQTGFPFVDAGMRQLNTTGYMHNRLRMITAQFLTKNLLIDWRMGERYFISRLVDGDIPNNNGGWQWSASTGTDSVPYFRVMNPLLQSKRFDPNAEFIHRFIPELRDEAPTNIHHGNLTNSKYPKPMVDLRKSRQRVLTVFKKLRQ